MGLRIGPGSWAAVISLKPTFSHRRSGPQRTVSTYSNLSFRFSVGAFLPAIWLQSAVASNSDPTKGSHPVTSSCDRAAGYGPLPGLTEQRRALGIETCKGRDIARLEGNRSYRNIWTWLSSSTASRRSSARAFAAALFA